jgi:hypothetical protein
MKILDLTISFTPRDYLYDEKAIEQEKKDAAELGANAKEQRVRFPCFFLIFISLGYADSTMQNQFR